MDELKKQAEELGIKVHGNWGETRLQAEIDKALEAPAPATVAVGEGHSVNVAITGPLGMSGEDVAASVLKDMPRRVGMQSTNLKPVTVTNLRANPSKALGLAGFGSAALSADQLADGRFMARIAHGVKTGVLSLS